MAFHRICIQEGLRLHRRLANEFGSQMSQVTLVQLSEEGLISRDEGELMAQKLEEAGWYPEIYEDMGLVRAGLTSSSGFSA